MVIYNRFWLSNLLLRDLVEKEHADGLISDSELTKIKMKYPVGFYSPNIFIRAGLLVLTAVISIFSCALLTLLFSGPTGIPLNYAWFFFLGVMNYLALEFIVIKKFHFRSGVDDALLWISFGLCIQAYWSANEAGNSSTDIAFCAVVCVLSLYLTLRFADMLMSLVCYLALFALIYFSWQKIGPVGIATMPFILMLFSGIVYGFARALNRQKTTFYTNCITVLQAISLVTVYASGNYYLVKELGDMLNNTKSQSIRLDWFFWTWTMTLPLAYIYWGIRRRDVIPIRIGLLLCVGAAYTLWHYNQNMPLELVLVLAGSLVLAVSWYLTKYLKIPRNGFTYEDLSGNTLMEQLKIESLIVSESSSGIGTTPVNTGTQMGGGKFGGGGASTEF